MRHSVHHNTCPRHGFKGRKLFSAPPKIIRVTRDKRQRGDKIKEWQMDNTPLTRDVAITPIHFLLPQCSHVPWLKVLQFQSLTGRDE